VKAHATSVGAHLRALNHGDGERVAFLFDLYQQMTSLLGVEKVIKMRKTRVTQSELMIKDN
jgi:hypothetical protein